MPTFFPQINSAGMMVQLPYTGGTSYETVISDMESGMRWAFPRRAGNLTGFPTNPLFHGVMSYPNISDTEREILRAFFDSMRGRWGRFSILDPGGNCLQFSEDFTQTYWAKTTVSVSGSMLTSDPFGRSLASVLTGSGSNSHILGTIGSVDGGLDGFVLNVSAWVNPSSNTSIFLGVADSGLSTLVGRTHLVYSGSWQRIEATVTVWTSGEVRFILGGNNTWTSQAISVFGAQCVPSKGSGGYVKSPRGDGGFGYIAVARFDTDSFTVRQDGPGHNSTQLPIVEVNA